MYGSDLAKDDELDKIKRELREARRALKDLWLGTTWGAGKAAAFEFNKRAMLAAGIEDVGD